MAPSTSAYLMADRLAEGKLAETIELYRRAGVSWKAIARLLQEKHGIAVGPDTLKTWAAGLDVDAEATGS